MWAESEQSWGLLTHGLGPGRRGGWRQARRWKELGWAGDQDEADWDRVNHGRARQRKRMSLSPEAEDERCRGAGAGRRRPRTQKQGRPAMRAPGGRSGPDLVPWHQIWPEMGDAFEEDHVGGGSL